MVNRFGGWAALLALTASLAPGLRIPAATTYSPDVGWRYMTWARPLPPNDAYISGLAWHGNGLAIGVTVPVAAGPRLPPTPMGLFVES